MYLKDVESALTNLVRLKHPALRAAIRRDGRFWSGTFVATKGRGKRAIRIHCGGWLDDSLSTLFERMNEHLAFEFHLPQSKRERLDEFLEVFVPATCRAC